MIRVLLAEDQLMFRDAAKRLLQTEGDIVIVAEVARGDQIAAVAARTTPDVALIDIEMPGGDGLAAIRDLLMQVPGCRALVLTAFGRPGFLQRALANGAAGFVLKDQTIANLANAIRRCAEGETVVAPEVVVAAMSLGQSPLTVGERDVLHSVTTGARVVEIAKSLHLSEGTVRNRISEALSKLYARNRIDAVRIATENGWL